MRALFFGSVLLSFGCAHQEKPVNTPDPNTLRPRTSFDLAAAIATPNPEGVTFTLDGAPVRRDGRVELSGWLENTASEVRTLTIFPVAPFGFLLQPAPGKATRRPPRPGEPPRPPPVPPPPELYDLQPQSRVRLTTSLTVADYQWPPGPMVLEWKFMFWNEPRPGGQLVVE